MPKASVTRLGIARSSFAGLVSALAVASIALGTDSVAAPATPAVDSTLKAANDSAASAAKALVSRVDSALTKVPPKKTAPPTDQAAIQETLNHFAMTVGNGEVAALHGASRPRRRHRP